MYNILLIGAGKSATVFIDYILQNAAQFNWHLTVADIDASFAASKIGGRPHGTAVALDSQNPEMLAKAIENHHIVVSMVPAHMHMPVARACLQAGKNLVTASYVSAEMEALDAEIKEKGLIFLNEMGVDPGIDHMSTMKLADELRKNGMKITGFETFTGGLLAPESENNPWKYKFTWNPRNVVMAASGGAVKFLHCGKYKYIPYHKVFRRTEIIDIEGWGEYEAYANRDSLKYQSLYRLDDVQTLYRGTLRRPGYCRSWDVFVQLGATDDTYFVDGVENLTHREFINSFLLYHPTDSIETKLAMFLKLDYDSEELHKLTWLGMFSDEPVGLKGKATPAMILQHILEKKWTLAPTDKDLIVMWHKIVFDHHGVEKEVHATLAVKGDDHIRTAMAKTVGLPLALGVKNIFLGNIKKTGVRVPVDAEIYEPVLKELEDVGIKLTEYHIR